MWIFRSAADGSDRRQDCRRVRPITSPRAERSVCATNCKNFARQTPSASVSPKPGATNYITARGAKRLRDELQKLRAANAVSERVTELEQILASVHVVDPPDAPSSSVTFGATVTVKDKKGATETLTIVGVDELNFDRDAVSWISPLGKALLTADIGDWITLDDGRSAKIVKIEFKTGSDRSE
ncbi:MAG: hypothetical protein DMF26_03245 [Verrucomicrobia bacterium]|nr:MAG: hypothetical protein DMF26_03245 [Verrucomicrobiota bacterium]